MAGERGDTGLQGTAGERGQKGDHGQHGEQGEQGARGEAGASTALTRNVTSSFLAVVFVSVAIIASFTYQAKQTHDLANANRKQIRANLVLRKQVDYGLCVALNQERAVLVNLIRGELAAGGGGARARKAALARLEQTTCPPKPVEP